MQKALRPNSPAGTLDSGIPVNVIKAIEQTIGVGVIPRTLLNPEVYGE